MITNEQFDAKVTEIAERLGVPYLLTIEGVWGCVSEDLNNQALKELE